MALAAYAGAAVALGGGRGALGQSPGPGLASSEGERVEQYIERLGLHELLAEHLRQRMADRTSSEARERARVAERLARLYAQMLSETTDPGKRAEIIAHGTELLRAGIGGRGFGLRLTLARERYRPAEELAERWRIGLVGEAERAGAVAELRAVRAQLAALSSEVARREREVSAALDNATAADPVALDNERRELLGFRVQADYYTAWCAYYAGLLGASPEATVEAVALFCRVLRVPSEKPTPEGFRTESFADEGLARSAVGLALSLGLAQKTTPASAWLDALEGEAATPPGVREGLLGWRIAVLAGGERWADLDRAIRQSREGKDGGPLSVVEARQLIELAQRATREGKDAGIATLAGGLMRLALEDLVTRRELAHVLELVREIGPDALGEGGMTRGFVGVYVMGRQALERAQGAHDAAGAKADEPASTPEIVNAFADAARLLNSATEQDDASFFPRDVPQALRFSGRGLFMAGRLREAAERYALAAEAAKKVADGTEAEACLWLAVGALDVASRRESSVTELAAIEERLASLSELYLRDHPAGERAATLALRQLARDDKLDERAVRALQSVTRGSALFEQSRRQLARLLYRQYRQAGLSDKAFASSRFLRAADEALGIDQRLGMSPGPEQAAALERAVTVARQMLDALLSGPTPDADRAEAVLAALDRMIETAQGLSASQRAGLRLDFALVGDERRLRAVQVVLARGRLDEAVALADAWRRDLDSRTAAGAATAAGTAPGRVYGAARTAIFREVERRWREQPQGPQRVDAARAVLAQGLALLAHAAPADESYADAGTASIAARAASAGAELWLAAQDSAARDAALRLDELILKSRPGVGESLRRVGVLAEAAGDHRRALEAWRQLAAGLSGVALADSTGGGDADTKAWFEAQFNTIRLLAREDRAGAATLAAQHLVLHPSGPEPWHGQIAQLARELGPPPAQSSPPPGAGAGAATPLRP